MNKHFDGSEFAQEDLYAAARADFGIFMELVFPVLHPGQSLDHAPYLDVVTEVIDLCTAGDMDRLIVNLPPGFLKSQIFSVSYPAWRLGVDPTYKFICISYGDDLAHKHATATRTLMQSDVYRAIFPETVLEKKAEHHITTTMGGFRYATACLSDITGFRANEIVVDDPMEPEDASSELVKSKLLSWITSSVLTRFIDNARNVFILVMHRLAPDDLAGTLSKRPGYFTLSMPLVAEEELTYYREDDSVITVRKVGEFLNPKRMTAAQLEKLKADIAPHAFDAQYQQRPRFGGTGMFSIDKLHRYEKAPKSELILHSWDIGATTTGNASVCTKWGVAKQNGHDTFFLIDIVKIKVELPDVRAAIKKEDAQDKPDLILLDHRGVGLGIWQEFRNSGWKHVMTVSENGKSNESKIDRFGKATLPMYDGLVSFPTSAWFLDELFQALMAFPDTKELDLVDSMTQLLAYIPQVLMYARQKNRPDQTSW